jgi:hypothetical protein
MVTASDDDLSKLLTNPQVTDYLKYIRTTFDNLHFRCISVWDLYTFDLKHLYLLTQIFCGLYDIRNKRELTTYYTDPVDAVEIPKLIEQFGHLFEFCGYEIECKRDPFYRLCCTNKIKWDPATYEPDHRYIDSNPFYTFRFPTVQDLDTPLVRTYLDFMTMILNVRINDPNAHEFAIDSWQDDPFKLSFMKYLQEDYGFHFYQEGKQLRCNFPEPEPASMPKKKRPMAENCIKRIKAITEYCIKNNIRVYVTDNLGKDFDPENEEQIVEIGTVNENYVDYDAGKVPGRDYYALKFDTGSGLNLRILTNGFTFNRANRLRNNAANAAATTSEPTQTQQDLVEMIKQKGLPVTVPPKASPLTFTTF